ncbi:MAG: DUF692 family protein [Kiloniellaceae bacterium]
MWWIVPRDFQTASPCCGIGLRAEHVADVIGTHPDIAWVEVHAENYMGGGRAIRDLEQVRDSYAVSLHGVGLSLGGAERPDPRHLQRMKATRRSGPMVHMRPTDSDTSFNCVNALARALTADA